MIELVFRLKIRLNFCSLLILVILIMPKAAPKRKAANGYKLAEPLPLGETLQDISKKQWKLGTSIGQGGFGAIYSAKEATDNSSKYPYVIKIEPHSNGPLFVEMHFYMRNSKKEDVEDFKKSVGLKTLGIPLYLGSGSHEYNGEKYRFVVMEKFGADLWKLFLENNRVFPASTVFKIAIQMLDILEYIHSRGYVHADLKGANILMGVTKDTQNKQLYLVDFGLATKFNNEPVFKPNPKKAHDGTIEYLSRDAHQGVQTRRGDLEILAYNMIQWLGCVLPWENNLKDPNAVFKAKDTQMSNVSKFMKTCFIKNSPPAPLVEFLNYLITLKHDTKPDYKKIRKIFLKGLDAGDKLDQPFKFSKSKTPKKTVSSPKRKVARKKVIAEASESEMEEDDNITVNTPSKKTPVKRNDSHILTTVRSSPRRKAVMPHSDDEEANKMDVDEDISVESSSIKTTLKRKGKNSCAPNKSKRKSPTRETISESSEDEKENDMDVDIEQNYSDASNNPEEVIIKTRPRKKTTKRTTKPKPVKEPSPKGSQGDNLNGYTDAMREVLQKKIDKKKSKKRAGSSSDESEADDMAGYTDTMKEIILKKKQRMAKKGIKK